MMRNPVTYTSYPSQTTTTTSQTTRYGGPMTSSVPTTSYSPGYAAGLQGGVTYQSPSYSSVQTNYGGYYQGTTSSPSGAYYAGTTTQSGSSIQYTSDPAQRYTPMGCQPVASYPHGISTIYSTGLVPAFMAPPQVKVTPSNLLSMPMVSEQSTTTITRS